MSKAFTRESDDAGAPVLKALRSLPPGVKNYITPQGVQMLRRKLAALPVAATPETRQLRQELEESLRSAVVTEPPPPPWEQVLFGAIVTVRNQNHETFTYQIVGLDETDIEHDRISWRSPIAKALLKARLGERIHFRAPGGEQRLEITGIRYES